MGIFGASEPSSGEMTSIVATGVWSNENTVKLPTAAKWDYGIKIPLMVCGGNRGKMPDEPGAPGGEAVEECRVEAVASIVPIDNIAWLGRHAVPTQG
jgi:hypothetical protein